MSARDPDRDVDDLLGDNGGDIGPLYRRLPRYEPPRRLDRAVLGEAARAIHSGKPPRRQRWIVGAGSAAGLVLAAGIAWRIGHDPMDSSGRNAPASAPVIVPVQPITESARAKQEESPRQSAASASAGARLDSTKDLETKPVSSNAISRVSVAPKASKARAPSAPPAATPPLPAPSAAPPPAEAFPEADRQRERSGDLDKSSAASAGVAQDAIRAQADDAAASNMRAEPSAARAAPSLSSPSGSIELHRDTQLAPQEWLAHIQQLVRQGRRQQAIESLRLFRRAHPDWVLPDELDALSK